MIKKQIRETWGEQVQSFKFDAKLDLNYYKAPKVVHEEEEKKKDKVKETRKTRDIYGHYIKECFLPKVDERLIRKRIHNAEQVKHPVRSPVKPDKKKPILK